MIDEYDVTIIEASLFDSPVSGYPAIRLEFSPHGLCFFDGGVLHRLFCSILNIHSASGWKRRAKLRSALGMIISVEPFTDREIGSMVGRLLRVEVEATEFRGRMHPRVVDFLGYLGALRESYYSDNEYMFMMSELLQGEEEVSDDDVL